MIHLLAASLEEAKQWCYFNGVRREDSRYLACISDLAATSLRKGDRVVRTAKHRDHPDSEVIELWLTSTLARVGLVEGDRGVLQEA